MILQFVVTALVINLTPGPAMVHCITSAAKSGPGAGFRAALGVELGVFAYVVATATGLAAVLVNAPLVYVSVRVAGALYLLYLAWTNLPRAVAAPVGAGVDVTYAVPLDHPFRRGFLLNVSNPKIALFFVTLLPQFVPATSSDTSALFLYGLAFNFSGLLVNSTAGLLGSRVALLQLGLNPTARRVLSFLPSAVFLSLAVVTLLAVAFE